MEKTRQIGLGGGCHWCTEAVFQSLQGVIEVQQGYIGSTGAAASFSEGVIVHYDAGIISLESLIEIHLHTHRSTSNHSFREKYRSAVYYLKAEDARECHHTLKKLQEDFEEEVITQVLPFKEFKASRESLQDYYRKNPEKPFCERYINPKLQILKKRFQKEMKSPVSENP